MGRRARLCALVAGLIVVVVLSLSGVWYAYWLLSGFRTRFAAGFSEEKFFQLRPGQTMDEVRATLGPPLSCREDRGGKELWEYVFSQGESAALAKRRERFLRKIDQTGASDRFSAAIFFDNQGKVVGVPDWEPFKRVPLGSSSAEVETLLGSPIKIIREPHLTTVCSYSEPQVPDANYEWWYVVFDERGRLIGINLQQIHD